MNRGPSLSPRPLKSEKLKIIRQGIRQWSSGPGYRGVRQLRLGTYKAPKISENKYAPNVISPHNLNDRLASYMRTRALRVPQQPPGRKSVNTIHRGSYGLVAQKLASRGFFDTVTYASFSISAGIAARFSQAAMVTQSSKSTAGFLMSIYVAWLPPGMPWIWFQQGYTNHARVHSVRSPILPTYSQCDELLGFVLLTICEVRAVPRAFPRRRAWWHRCSRCPSSASPRPRSAPRRSW